MVVLNTVIK